MGKLEGRIQERKVMAGQQYKKMSPEQLQLDQGRATMIRILHCTEIIPESAVRNNDFMEHLGKAGGMLLLPS